MNFCKIGDFNPMWMRFQLLQHRDLWRQCIETETTGQTHTDCQIISARIPPIPADAGKSKKSLASLEDNLFSRNEIPWHMLSALRGAVYDLFLSVQGTHLGKVLLVRLPSRGVIKPHTDGGLSTEFYDRYHIVVDGPPQCWFHCGDERIAMLSGEVWWFNAGVEHYVENLDDADRISVVVDINSI